MSILVYIENIDGTLKKSAFELLTYARAIGELTQQDVIALNIGTVDASSVNKIGEYGVEKLIQIDSEKLTQFVNQAYASIIAEVAQHIGANTVIIANSFNGKGLAPRIATKLGAALVDGAISLPTVENDVWKIKKTAFSNKAIAHTELHTSKRVITLTPNSFEAKVNPVSLTMETYDPKLVDGDFSTLIKNIVRATDKVALPDADIVVSAGRGLKGPENWGMIEELAAILGAATACSKPVSDAGWRPHSEHVGQTGLAVSPKLYIAIGISGAIQHLAGVSSSKTIVVINKDPEAPFFKVADYGIVGDAFEIIPQLIEAIKTYKNN
ncbi:electron transfer flavoprotein subunit alpha/FixB family protein [Sphingobacterium sp. LRF_L2]|uniref:electron transfer flavoprotein subunit alpha/FixB family protein n=1 Tax=Sphingobacterium sp. LRF_L2 TaxID=3369421 RepID=UPI003F5D6248